MARRKQSPKHALVAPKSEGPKSAGPKPGGELLVNNLSVVDARHLLRSEGGELTPLSVAWRLVSLAVVQVPVAWAIATGGATLWHLLLPMFGQYFGCLLAIPLAYAWWKPTGLKKDAVGSVRLLIGFAVAAAVATYLRSQQNHLGWGAQAELDARAALDWVVGYKMHWPVLAAVVTSMLDTHQRVLHLIEHGPPYVGVSLGCAMRFLIVLLGVFLLPLVAAYWDKAPGGAWGVNAPWIVWGVVVLAELLALAMVWDLQRRLGRLDAAAPVKTASAELEPSHPLDL